MKYKTTKQYKKVQKQQNNNKITKTTYFCGGNNTIPTARIPTFSCPHSVSSSPRARAHFSLRSTTLRKVHLAPDLFVIHAAYACILHPGTGGNQAKSGTRVGGWWSGGTEEEAWWRAVWGGRRAVESIGANGCDSLGELFSLVRERGQCLSSKGPSGMEHGAMMAPGAVDHSVPDPPVIRSGSRAHEDEGARKLRGIMNDDDLADTVTSLLRKLACGFEELRVSRYRRARPS